MHGRRPAAAVGAGVDRKPRLRPGLLAALALLGAGSGAPAQTEIVTDGGSWMGPEVSCTGSCVIDESLGYRPGGPTGTNLFQSFLYFDVGEGDTATFTADYPTSNVISAVNGGRASQILGTIESQIPDADFYLLNPSGVTFGDQSHLNVPGSFTVATADALGFSDGGEFGALPPPPAAMQIASAESFGFLVRSSLADLPAGDAVPTELVFAAGEPHPEAIVFDQTAIGLSGLLTGGLRAGGTFTAVGGRVKVLGPTASEAQKGLDSAGGVIQLGAVPSGTVVPLDLAELPADALDAADAVVEVVGNGAVNVTGTGPGGPGRVVIRAGEFVMDRDVLLEEGIVRSPLQPLVSAYEAGAGDVPGIDIAAGRSISVRDGMIVSDADSSPSGDIRLSAPLVTATRQARIESRSQRVAGPDIEIDADELNVNGRSEILSTALVDDGGAIRIGSEADPVALVRIGSEDPMQSGLAGGNVGSVTRANGVGGDVEVHAGRLVVVGGEEEDDTAQIAALTTRFNESTDYGVEGGSLVIRADSIELTNGGQLRVATDGMGDAGAIDVQATGAIVAQGAVPVSGGDTRPSGIFARSQLFRVLVDDQPVPLPQDQQTMGSGGDLTIVAASLEVLDGAEIATDSERVGAVSSQGAAGDLTITADSILVDGGADPTVFSTISSEGAGGPGGTLEITADSLELTNGGQLTASTNGVAAAGDVRIFAHEIEVAGDGSEILSQANQAATGPAGSIRIAPRDGDGLSLVVTDEGRVSVEGVIASAGSLDIVDADLVQLSDGGSISATARNVPASQQDPGNIRIQNAGSVQLLGGEIVAETNGNAPGGQIEIDAANVLLVGGRIDSRSTLPAGGGQAGEAGDILITASDSFQASQGSVVTTQKNNAGGGRIQIQAPHLVSIVDSQVVTEATAAQLPDDAGDIQIGRSELVAINRSTVSASAFGNANAGNISVAGEYVFISADSLIEATAEVGVAGVIDVEAPETDIVGQLTRLPSDYVDPADRLLPPCSARRERTGSFTVQTRDALPPPPDAPLPARPADETGVAPPAPNECAVLQENS